MNSLKIFLFFNFIFALFRCQFVTTVLNGNRYFSQNSPQENIDISFETGNDSIVQYSLWGWMKYNGNQPGISNFLVLRNLDGSNSTSQSNINTNYPICPYSQIELEQNPDLLRQELVSSNPNCFINQQTSNTQSIGPDILYINHDLNPGMETYSLVFLIQNGILNTGQAEMQPEGFADLQFKTNSWIFFAISCDYRQGQIILHAKEYSNSSALVKNETVYINHPSFQMRKRNRFIFANKSLVPYFQTETFFIGNIAYVQTAPFFVNTLEELWTGYLNENFYSSHGVLVDFLYDIQSQQKSVESYGFYKESYTIEGNFQNLYTLTRNQFGIQIKTKSYIQLGNFDFKNSEQIQPFLFSLDFKYKEPLPLNYVLLQRGNQGQNGNLKIYLFKENSGRVITMELTGRGNSVNWKSSSLLLPDEKLFIYVGFIISPANSVYVLYYDSKKSINIELLSNNFEFDMSALQLNLFQQNQFDQQENVNGFLDIYRTTIFNTTSSVLFKYLFNSIADQQLISLNNNCQIRSDFYRQSFACLRCEQTNLNLNDYSCTESCPFGFRNGGTGVCIQCFQNQCTEANNPVWQLTKINENQFQLKPSAPIVNLSQSDIDNLIDVNIQDLSQELGDYSYTKSFNPQNQTIDLIFDFNKKIRNNQLTINIISDPSQPRYDQNGNLIYNQIIIEELGVICNVRKYARDAAKAFSILILIFVLGSLLVLIVITMFFWSRIKYLGYFWKFWLHNWMNLQLLVFFYFIGVEQPCVLKEFYRILYLITVKWNYLLRGAMKMFERESFAGDLEDYRAPQTVNYLSESVSAWILANFGLIFILHCIFLFFYIIVKAVSFLKINQIVKYIVLIWEYTGFIVFFLLFHMQIFVFSILNMKQYVKGHPLFAICLTISVLYIFIFSAFWIYSTLKMIGSQFYFEDSLNKSRFIFYLIGYKDKKICRTYDLVKVFVHFIIAILIGAAYNKPLTQTIIIFILLFLLLVFAIVFRPWIWIYQMVAEVVFLLFIWIVSILYLAMASKNNQNCYQCLDREGFISWFLMILMFLAFLIATVMLFFLIFASMFKPNLIKDKSQKFMQIEVKDNYKNKKKIVDDVLSQSQINQSNKTYADLPLQHNSKYQQINQNDSQGHKFLQKLNRKQKTSLIDPDIINHKNTIPEEDENYYNKLRNDQSQLNRFRHGGMIQPDDDTSYISYQNNTTLMADDADDEELQFKVIHALRNPQRQAQEEIDQDYDYRRDMDRTSKNTSNKFDRDINTQTYFSSDKMTPPFRFDNSSQNPFSKNESVDFQNVQGDKNYYKF